MRNTTTPNTLKNMCARAARRACVLAVSEAMKAVIVVPMFCPIAKAAACSKPKPGMFMPKSMSVMAIVAAEACTIIVTTAPTTTKSRMVKNESCGTCDSMPATMSPMFMALAASCRNDKPMKRNEKPKMNSPMLFLWPFPLNISGMPMASIGMANAAMFTLKPTAEIIHAVTVVPMLAPMITPMDCASVIRPAFTKLTTITVVALDDWMRAVMRIPVSTPITRFFVIAAKILRRRSPANFSRPSDMVFIPKRNSASEPRSEKMLIINSIALF